jgi:short-subunit dehydrogenase
MQKSILITGCSSGIGLETAIQLKQRGHRVFAGARKNADVERLNKLGLESIFIDVNDSDSIQQALDTVLQRTGGTLDAIFNNAGYLQAGAIEDLTRAMERAQFETNVFGSMDLTQRVLPIMRKQGHGRIIQNSSILGIVAIAYCGAYNASKFAIEGFCNTLRQELRGSNIYVSLINPGPIVSHLRENAHQQFKATLQNEQTGLHKKIYEKMEQSYFKAERKNDGLTLTPDAVAKQVIHALESTSPHAHYYIGNAAKGMALLRRLLPDYALDWILNKVR